MLKADFAAIDRRDLAGPFDIIGDVHGCCDELETLLARLGYDVTWRAPGGLRVTAPRGRRAVFVGDYADRGPRSPDVLRLVANMVASGTALAIPGNHDYKLWRWLKGRDVKPSHGFETTMAQFAREAPGLRSEIAAFLESLPTYLWLDGGRLVISHAGLQENMIGQIDNKTLNHSIYGDTDGKKDAAGLAIRYNWAAHYQGKAFVTYGHVVVPEVAWVNNTACIDTACVFGGSLTALCWPEKRLVSVPAREAYYPSRRPFGLPPARTDAQRRFAR